MGTRTFLFLYNCIYIFKLCCLHGYHRQHTHTVVWRLLGHMGGGIDFIHLRHEYTTLLPSHQDVVHDDDLWRRKLQQGLWTGLGAPAFSQKKRKSPHASKTWAQKELQVEAGLEELNRFTTSRSILRWSCPYWVHEGITHLGRWQLVRLGDWCE